MTITGLLKMIEAGGLMLKLAMGAGLIGLALVGYGVWHHKVYKSGVDDAIAGIARADKGWIDKASTARGKWKDCNSQNRGWDQTTGKCL